MGQLLLQEVGLGQPAVQGQELLAQSAFAVLQVRPAAQQPALPSQQAAGRAALAEALGPAGLIERFVDVAQDVELVVHDPGLGQVLPEALHEGLPHVHAPRPDRPPKLGRQGLDEEPVQGLPPALQPDSQGFAPLQVTDDGEELVALAKRDRIDPEGLQGLPSSARRPAAQDTLIHAAHGLGGQPLFGRHPAHRSRLTVLGHGRLQARRGLGLACQRWEPLGAHPAAATPHPMPLHHQPDLPGPPGQSPDPPLRPAVHVPDRDPAAAADVAGLGRGLPNPEGQRPAPLLRLPGVHPVARQAQNA